MRAKTREIRWLTLLSMRHRDCKSAISNCWLATTCPEDCKWHSSSRKLSLPSKTENPPIEKSTR